MRLLILGTGRMAVNHAKAFQTIAGVEMVGAVDTDPANLQSFADMFGIGQRFASFDAALAWGQFDAVDNVTPD
ncbi:MAG: gfo/Idh/MocA family oxidoreductase, partial [Hyphomicrobiales bacterium]